MKVNFFDPNIARKSKLVEHSLQNVDGWPLPAVVEISESGTCNRSCSFCPRSAPDFPDIKQFIDAALLDKLTNELAAFNYRGIFLFSGFVEPMLDAKIYDHISLVRKNLPFSKIEIVTNGDVLNEERLSRLFKCGLTTLLISVYDSASDALRFEEMCRTVGLVENQFVIRHRYLSESQSFGITLNNRAGMMSNAKHSIPKPRQALREPCFYPHYTFFMDYLGDVLMCPHDWGKRKIVGNLYRQSFKSIWLSPEFGFVRQNLAAGRRTFTPCNVCDVKGTLIGSAHLRAWESD